MLARIRGRIRHAALDHLSPFSVSVILEIGRQRSPGEGAGEIILAGAAEDLIAEAVA
jgi:ATP-dependent Lhr-like helicase